MVKEGERRALHYRWEFLRRNPDFRKAFDASQERFSDWFQKRGWWYDPDVKYSVEDLRYIQTTIFPVAKQILNKWKRERLIPYDWSFDESGHYEFRKGVYVSLLESRYKSLRRLEEGHGDVFRLDDEWVAYWVDQRARFRSGEVINGESIPDSYLDRHILLSVDITFPVKSNLAGVDAEIRNARREYKKKHGSFSRTELRHRRRFAQFEDYLRVWDLKEQGLSLAKIAKQLHPGEDALDRVTDHYRRAKELIGGGYRELE
jgi:hypothetical protein